MLDDHDRQLLTVVQKQGKLTPGEAARLLGVARMTGYRRLNGLVKRKLLRRTAERGRDVAYVLVALRRSWSLKGLDETSAWRQIEPALLERWSLGKDDADAVHYLFTEMVNNAIDHSGGSKVSADIDGDAGRLRLVITDDGIGAFERVRSERGLDSVEDAALQIEKGKQTTMPERHSGEGLFFSSKISERFRLEANGRAWLVDNSADDSLLERTLWRGGTRVTAWLRPGSIPRLESVFGKYTDADGAFTKTKTTVKLAEVGDTFLSRSQARRIATGLDKFKHVTLDFHGVERLGQGFVDELFRVFAAAHPAITLAPTRMADDVAFMVTRGAPARADHSAPAVPSAQALDDAFLEMHPERVMRALELAGAAAATTSPTASLALASHALLGLLRIEPLAAARASLDAGARARLATCVADVDAVAHTSAAAARALALAPLEARELEGTVALAALALAVARRVTSTPKLWRWFVDDDAIERFFALPEQARRDLWGAPVAPPSR